MKLRLAKKIWNRIGGPHEKRYSHYQIGRALRRFDRTASERKSTDYWNAMMRFLGPSGRADLFVRWGMPATALDILMRSEMKDWKGDKTVFGKLLK